MSKALRATGAAIAGIALGLVGITVFAGAASAVTAQDVVTTAHIVNTPDDGNPPWARDTFIRTTTIHENDNNTFTVKIQDNGTFTTVKGSKSPGSAIKVINEVTGKFTGHAEYTVSWPEVTLSAQTKHMVKATVVADETWNYTDCGFKGDTNGDCATLPKTGTWPEHFFDGNPTAVLKDNWSWKYTTDCETREENVSGATGNITGMTCPTVAPVVQPKPSASASPAAVVPVSQPSLPVTGVNVPVIVTTGIIVLAIGGFAIFFTRRRKTN